MKKPQRDAVTIIVRPRTNHVRPDGAYPLMAYISGTKASEVDAGYGATVQAAVEDLFTSASVGKVCRELEARLPLHAVARTAPDGRRNRDGEA